MTSPYNGAVQSLGSTGNPRYTLHPSESYVIHWTPPTGERSNLQGTDLQSITGTHESGVGPRDRWLLFERLVNLDPFPTWMGPLLASG